jgi:hypothetical protein
LVYHQVLMGTLDMLYKIFYNQYLKISKATAN